MHLLFFLSSLDRTRFRRIDCLPIDRFVAMVEATPVATQPIKLVYSVKHLNPVEANITHGI